MFIKTLALAAGLLAPAAAHAATIFAQVDPLAVTYVEGVDYKLFTPIVAYDVTGALDTVANLGCAATDYAGFTVGAIALIERGTCLFSDKILLAAAAGAIGAVIYDSLLGTLPDSTTTAAMPIAAVFASRAVGQSLLDPPAVVRIRIEAVPPVVPLPAPLALLGTGMLALWAGLRPRRSSRS